MPNSFRFAVYDIPLVELQTSRENWKNSSNLKSLWTLKPSRINKWWGFGKKQQGQRQGFWYLAG